MLGRKAGETVDKEEEKKEEQEEEELVEEKESMRKPLRTGTMKKFLNDIYLPHINWYETPVFGCRPDFGYVIVSIL